MSVGADRVDALVDEVEALTRERNALASDLIAAQSDHATALAVLGEVHALLSAFIRFSGRAAPAMVAWEKRARYVLEQAGKAAAAQPPTGGHA